MAKQKIKLQVSVSKSIHGTAWVVARDPATGKYLICRRAKGTNNSGQWGFPGGGVDEGEKHDQAAARETFEEIKVRVTINDLHYVVHSDDTQVLWFELFKKINPKATEEVDAFEWVTPTEMQGFKLHKSVKDYFKALREQVR